MEYFPKEVIFQLLLNIEPEFLSYVCSLNKKFFNVCSSDLFKKVHKEKYLRLGIGNEKNYPVDDYMKRQKNITPGSRTILIKWLFEVAESYKLNEKSLFLAIKILDLYSARKNDIERSEYQLIGCVCLHLAGQLKNDFYNLDVGDYIYISDKAFTIKQFEEKTEDISSTLEGIDLRKIPTVIDYYDQLSLIFPLPEKFEAYYKLLLISIDYLSVTYFPSILTVFVIEDIFEEEEEADNFAFKYEPDESKEIFIKEQILKIENRKKTLIELEKILRYDKEKLEEFKRNYTRKAFPIAEFFYFNNNTLEGEMQKYKKLNNL